MVKLLDISSLEHRIRDENFDEEKYEASIRDKLKANHGKLEENTFKPKDGEDDKWESGDDEDMSDESDDDSSDEEKDGKKNKKKDKNLNPKNATLSMSKKMAEDAHRKDFFDDL